MQNQNQKFKIHIHICYIIIIIVIIQAMSLNQSKKIDQMIKKAFSMSKKPLLCIKI